MMQLAGKLKMTCVWWETNCVPVWNKATEENWKSGVRGQITNISDGCRSLIKYQWIYENVATLICEIRVLRWWTGNPTMKLEVENPITFRWVRHGSEPDVNRSQLFFLMMPAINAAYPNIITDKVLFSPNRTCFSRRSFLSTTYNPMIFRRWRNITVLYGFSSSTQMWSRYRSSFSILTN